jgi:hypothetical protein
MLVKVIIVLFLVVIIYSLGSGLYFLLHDKGENSRVVLALTWRIVLSLVLFGLLFLAYATGLIVPHQL